MRRWKGISRPRDLSASPMKLKKSMQAYADQQAENELKEQLLNQVCDSASFEVSAEQINAALDLMMQSLESQLARQGLA